MRYLNTPQTTDVLVSNMMPTDHTTSGQVEVPISGAELLSNSTATVPFNASNGAMLPPTSTTTTSATTASTAGVASNTNTQQVVRRKAIIHYDLKPANILFDEFGDVKITGMFKFT